MTVRLEDLRPDALVKGLLGREVVRAEKFELHFELLSRDLIRATGLANPFQQRPLLIAPMDMLSRDEELQHWLLQAPEWDLLVCDESHRMSARYSGRDVKRTRRYEMGKRVGSHARNLLLMTATPHNGKEEDFQLFMALLDEDRFAGQQRDAVRRSNPDDLMRRLVKEDLYTFQGTRLFPERHSYTAEYELSDPEKLLYERVTAYVREEMNRADRHAETEAEGGSRKRVNVGFALMTLQRRLASSPFAIQRSLERRRERLERILDDRLMKEANGTRRKLVLFSEFRDTLTDLARKIRDRLGRPEAVVTIHGGVPRDRCRQIVHAFMNDPEVVVLLANDAAGEGVNLQRAHLMVNYDLPWNPNRLEQRFGRIHRIGQKQVCHLWNLLARDTREGDVYIQLLRKLEAAREALGDKVFDVLGQLFSGRSLQEMLMAAVRYNRSPEVKARLEQEIEGAVDRQHLETLLDRRALVQQGMDTTMVGQLRQEMERAMARRIHPH